MKTAEEIRDIAHAALDELKGKQVEVLDVRELSTVTDYLVIATGTSKRHLQSLAENVELRAKEQGAMPLGLEGKASEWVLVDFGPVVVHVMSAEARDFYDLERLWGATSASRSAT